LLCSHRTAETIARFIQPLMIFRETERERHPDWVTKLANDMQSNFGSPDQRTSRAIEKMVLTANSGRIYVEQLYLHPVRLSLTFTQEWMDWNQSADTVMIFQFIRGMVRFVAFDKECPYISNIFIGVDCKCTSCFHFVFCWTCIRGPSSSSSHYCDSLLVAAHEANIWYSG
jgi:hypothetical protein